jgi:hypothetical protein
MQICTYFVNFKVMLLLKIFYEELRMKKFVVLALSLFALSTTEIVVNAGT